MLKNFLKIAWRNLLKNKGYNLVATIGLSVAVACFLLVGLYVYHEVTYESHHENADQIYRVGKQVNFNGIERHATNTANILGPTAVEQFPSVKNSAQLSRMRDTKIEYGEVSDFESHFYYTDSSIFELFTIPFSQGNPETVLSAPNSIVISEQMVKKYFGEEDPIGKSLMIRERSEFTVSGIIEDPPANTDIPFHFLAHPTSRMAPNWNSMTSITTYLLTEPDVDPEVMEQKLLELTAANVDDPMLEEYVLDRLDRMHLHATISPTGDIRYIYIFSLVAVFLLAIAIINYINLSIAQLIPRSREVAIRKTLGARQAQLGFQYFAETFLVSLFAVVTALLLVEMFKPLINTLPGITLASLALGDIRLWLSLAILALIITVFSGSYITFYLARLDPSSIFQMKGHSLSGSTLLQKGLITFQFFITIALICSTFIVQGQLNYIQDSRLGFDKEHLLVLNLEGNLDDQYEILMQQIEGLAGVKSVSAANSIPGDEGVFRIFLGEDYPLPSINLTTVGKDFPSHIGMEWMTPEPQNLSDGDWILNESAAEALGLSELDGQRIEQVLGMEEDPHGFRGDVTGIVRDFNYRSLHSEIEPIALEVGSESLNKLAVRLEAGFISEAMDDIQAAWSEFAPGLPIDYVFLDDRIDSMYRSDRLFAQIFWAFSMITVIIACMGLFSLAALSAKRRTKEIGIRKVLGATVRSIAGLLARDYIKLVALGFIIAVPVSWYFMNRWLADFAYRMEPGPGIFALAGATALVIALVTVSWQSFKAATANPVDSLRSE